MRTCSNCGEANPDRFRICGICGSQLVVAAPAPDTRRTVSIVFSDLVGSTALGERLGPEPLREALAIYFDTMRAVVERHGGVIEKYIGDAIMAVFGLPTSHEDDALRAVRAAVEMRERLGDVNAELERRWAVRLETRTGINTGEVVAGDAGSGQRLVTGPTVNTAARLEQAAGPSEILLAATTHALVHDAVVTTPLGPLDLKGVAGPVAAVRVEAISGVDGIARRLDAPLIGRRVELAVLRDALADVVRTGSRRWVNVIGSAGVGKTRLIDAFVSEATSASLLRGRCLSYGEGITFWPLAEAIRTIAAIDEGDAATAARDRLIRLCRGRVDVAERLAPLLGSSDASFPLEETFWAVRRLVDLLADEGPVLLVLDDIHWAEATLLELVDHLIAEGTAPLLVVGSARDDFLDEHPGWADTPERSLLDLEALAPDDLRRFVADLLGAGSVPTSLTEMLIRATAGNPLFVEQLVTHLREGGRLMLDSDGDWSWHDGQPGATLPPTIDALLSARIDQLGIESRSVMQAGSVIGLDFYRGAVAAMSPPEMAAVIGPSLATLTRRRLVRPVPPTLADEPTYRFGHQLIRDAAYAGLLLRRRAELHRRFAEWLDGVAGPRLAELDELVGYHLEQAAHSLSAIGSTDPEDLDVATRAAGRLARAGARAFERGDMPAAANLHRRAVELLPATSEERPRLLLDLAEISADLGEIPVAAGLLDEALAAARDRADARLETNARLVRLYVRYTLDPHGESDAVVSAVRAAAPVLEAVEDHEGLVRAWRLLGWVHATACHYGAAEQAVSRAVEEARLAGDRRAVTRNQMSFAVSALHGPMPVGDAIVRCERILAEVAEDRRAEGVVLGALSHLMAMDGRFEDARGLYRRARTTLEELGGSIMAATVSLDSGRVELLAGDPRAAERELRRDFDVLERIGERYALSSVAALLARALLLQGRRTDAIRFAQSSEAAAAPDDVEAQNLWRRVRALSLAEDGDRRAIDLIDDALEMLRSADAPVLSAGTLLDRAEIHARLGEPALARAAAQAANERFIEKGDRVEAQRAARLLDAIAGDRPA